MPRPSAPVSCYGLAPRPRRGWFRLEHRDREMELRTLTDFALHPNAAAMRFDQMLGDGKAQPGAAHLAGTGHVDPVEALEDPWLVRPRNSHSGVGNSERYFIPVCACADHDLAAGRSVLNGVVQKVLQDLGEEPSVRSNVRYCLADVHGNAQAFFSGGALRGLDAAFHELRHAQTANLQLQPLGIHLRKFEQVIGEPRKTARMIQDDLEQTEPVLPVI